MGTGEFDGIDRPLYVDRDEDNMQLLRVYRLNDALKAIQKVMK